MPSDEVFCVTIKKYLNHQGSVFIVLWCNFLLNWICDNLIMQMIRYRMRITGNHIKLFLALLIWIFLCLKISNCAQLCLHPPFSAWIKETEGRIQRGLVYFWRPCLPCLPWTSRLSETGGAWSDWRDFGQAPVCTPCPFSSCTDYFIQHSARHCSLDQCRHTDRLMESNTYPNSWHQC